MSRALTAARLSYSYPDTSSRVLHGLDFEIERGEVFGFLGPNGSGKSTTQKILTRILHGYEGTVEVLGRDLGEQDHRYFERVGVCFEFPNLYGKLTAEENLDFYRRFFDGPTEEPAAVLEALDLPVGDRRRLSHFSKGMKMRVVLARSLLNRPELLFLDEPTSGQDPQHSVLIRKLIARRAREGTTIFLTTHDMTVADELCDRVAFLVDGRIVAVGSPKALKLEHAERLVRVEYRDSGGTASRQFSLARRDEKRAFLSLVAERDVETIHTLEPSLETVFLEVTGRGLR